MSTTLRMFHVLTFIGLFVVAGCATNRGLDRQVSMLHNQVIALTNEVTNLSDNQRALERVVRTTEQRQRQIAGVSIPQRAQMVTSRSSATKETKRAVGQAIVKDGVYRTPSGFELPVLSIQSALRNAGYYKGNVDGVVGKVTEDSIVRFQEDYGLEPDGVVGRNTWEHLKQFS